MEIKIVYSDLVDYVVRVMGIIHPIKMIFSIICYFHNFNFYLLILVRKIFKMNINYNLVYIFNPNFI